MSGRVARLPTRSVEASPPPCDLEAEQAVLGGALLAGRVIGVYIVEEHLRPEHFYRQRHEIIWRAIMRLHEQGINVDVVTLADDLLTHDELDQVGGKVEIDALTAAVPSVGNLRQYAQIVVEKAKWRARRVALYDALAAVDELDERRFTDAEAAIARATDRDREQRTLTPDQLGEQLFRYLADPDVETFSWPFKRFDKLTLGGMRRGQLTLVAGPTSHGKSVMLDMTLEAAAAATPGLRAHLYINEMSIPERNMRVAARRSGVALEKISLKQLDDHDRKRLVRAMGSVPFGITECSGWSAQDIARDVLHHRYDLVAVDLINRLPHKNMGELEEQSRVLNQLCKPSQGNCHVLVAAHLNRNRAGFNGEVPVPTLADIRESGMLANDADNVVFVWREQDLDTGDPLTDGVIRISKLRLGRRGGVAVFFDGDHQVFLEKPEVPA